MFETLTQSSVGVLYSTILNLPRHIRNTHQYTILAGVIPGPHEPKRDVNSFLQPLVKELLLLWDGILLNVNSKPQLIRGALLCVACDIPAARKVAGFLGHSARYGCSRCLKEFPGGFGKRDYSGFDRNTWTPQTNEGHRSAVKRIKKCTNKTQRQKLESDLGCRYSTLLKLEYFNPVRMVIVDPMHNLFLGSAKHMMKELWLGNQVLTHTKLLEMQQLIDDIHVPPDCGRIPRKLETSFAGFTAAQFKNWVTLYSIPALYGQVEKDHLECWRHFVLTCRILCKNSLNLTDI